MMYYITCLFCLLSIISLSQDRSSYLKDQIQIQDRMWELDENVTILDSKLKLQMNSLHRITDNGIKDQLHIKRAFFCIYQIANDSIFLIDIKAFVKDSLRFNKIRGVILNNSKLFMSNITDTLRFSYGRIIRREDVLPIRERVFEKQRVIIVSNGLKISDTVYHNVLVDSNKLSRHFEEDLTQKFSDVIKQKIKWSKGLKKQENHSFRIDIIISKDGFVDYVNIREKELKYLETEILGLGPWETLLNDGKPVPETLRFILKVNYKKKMVILTM